MHNSNAASTFEAISRDVEAAHSCTVGPRTSRSHSDLAHFVVDVVDPSPVLHKEDSRVKVQMLRNIYRRDVAVKFQRTCTYVLRPCKGRR